MNIFRFLRSAKPPRPFCWGCQREVDEVQKVDELDETGLCPNCLDKVKSCELGMDILHPRRVR